MKKLFLLTAFLVTAVFYGCSDTVNNYYSNPTVQAYAENSGDCLVCHSDKKNIFAMSEHIGKGTVNQNMLRAAGNESCVECHDTRIVNGDVSDTSTIITKIYDSIDDMNRNGVVGVTCIDCHQTLGSTASHYGVPKPSYTDCKRCHTDVHGNNIVENFAASGHSLSHTRPALMEVIDGYDFLKEIDGKKYIVNAGKDCMVCHLDDTFRKYFKQDKLHINANGEKTFTSFANDITPKFLNSRAFRDAVFDKVSKGDLFDYTGMECRTCHDTHAGSYSRKDVKTDTDSYGAAVPAGTVVFSAEYKLCTQCHGINLKYRWDNTAEKFDYEIDRSLHDNVTGMVSADNLDERTAIYPLPGQDATKPESIDFTNANMFDTNATQPFHLSYGTHNATHVEGQVYFTNQPQRMPFRTARTILDTHFKGVFVSDIIYKGEGVAGVTKFAYILKRLPVKGYNINAAAKNACTSCHDPHLNSMFGVTTPGEWDYAWDADGPIGGSSRLAAINKSVMDMTDEWGESRHGDYKAGDATGCGSCHDLTVKEKLSTGAYRFNLGATLNWESDNFTFAWKDIIDGDNFKALGDDNVRCMSCHAGKVTLNAVNGLPNNVFTKAFDTKYAPAKSQAAIYWGNSGYEYAGKNYESGKILTHGNAQVTCISCHDAGKKTHTFKALASGGITSKSASCLSAACHGADGKNNYDAISAREINFKRALSDVAAKLEAAAGASVNANYADSANTRAYFVNTLDTTSDFTNWNALGDSKKLYGTAANLYMLQYSTAKAVYHNDRYVKQLIWDMMEALGGTKADFSAAALLYLGESRP